MSDPEKLDQDLIIRVVDAKDEDGNPYHGPAVMPLWMSQALGYDPLPEKCKT